MPSLIESLKGNKLINSSNIYDGGRLLNNVLENYRRIISQMPTVDGEGESITLNGCINAEFLKFELGGNTSQEEGTSLESPQDIHVVKGHNEFKIANAGDTEFQTFPLDLPEGMEMCGMGDYADTFEKVGVKLYKSKNVHKYTFTGDENWILKNDGGHSRFEFHFTEDLVTGSAGTGIMLSSYFKPDFSVRNKNIFISGSSNNICVIYDGQSLSSFKGYLASNNLVVYCALATPILQKITDPTLISQLEAIKRALSYAGTTIITQENEDLPFNISVSALKDLHTLEYANYLNE